MGLINKLFNAVRYGVLTTDQQEKSSNNKVFYNAQIRSYNSINNSQILYPYGYYAVAPKTAQCLTVNIGAQAENKASIAFDIATQFSGLKPYEVQVGNQKNKNYINFLNNGSINILTPNGDLTVKTLGGNREENINGNSSTYTSGTETRTVAGDDFINVTGNIEWKSDADVFIESNNETVVIEGSTTVTLIVGAATLTLTSANLISSVPITAPGLAITGAGNIAMAGGTVSGMSDLVTQAGKSFNTHTHSPGTYTAGGSAVTGTSGTLV